MYDKFDSGNDKFDSYVPFQKTYLDYQKKNSFMIHFLIFLFHL